MAYPTPAPTDFERFKNFVEGHLGKAVGSAEAVFAGTTTAPAKTSDNSDKRIFIQSV